MCQLYKLYYRFYVVQNKDIELLMTDAHGWCLYEQLNRYRIVSVSVNHLLDNIRFENNLCSYRVCQGCYCNLMLWINK